MNSYFTLQINRMALRLALFSLLGTSLWILISLASYTDSIFWAGAVFIALSLLLNVLMLAIQTLNLIFNYKKFEENVSAMVLVLTNLFIMVLYLNCVFNL